jgi:hypothetical protein
MSPQPAATCGSRLLPRSRLLALLPEAHHALGRVGRQLAILVVRLVGAAFAQFGRSGARGDHGSMMFQSRSIALPMIISGSSEGSSSRRSITSSETPVIAENVTSTSNGGKTLAQLHEHNAYDTLVGWAWNPNPGRARVPGTQAQFGELTKAWIDSGAQCPSED